MRTLLVFLTAVALPLYARAQPVDNSTSTVVSELVVEGSKGQCPPGNPHGPFAISNRFDAPPDTKNKRTEESAGTRAFVQTWAAGARNNDVDYTNV